MSVVSMAWVPIARSPPGVRVPARAIMMPGSSVAIADSPRVSIAQYHGGSVERQEHDQQHDYGRRGDVTEFVLRAAGPLVDLDRESGELGERPARVGGDERGRADHHQRRRLTERPGDRQDGTGEDPREGTGQ